MDIKRIDNENSLLIDLYLPKLIEGKSAYQIAVVNGFKGTEKEWLESLKGTGGEGITNEQIEKLINDALAWEKISGI